MRYAAIGTITVEAEGKTPEEAIGRYQEQFSEYPDSVLDLKENSEAPIVGCCGGCRNAVYVDDDYRSGPEGDVWHRRCSGGVV